MRPTTTATEICLWFFSALFLVLCFFVVPCVSTFQWVFRWIVLALGTILALGWTIARRRGNHWTALEFPGQAYDASFLSNHRRKITVGLLIVHGVLLGIQGARNTPTLDEWGHLPSGLYHWQTGDFSMHRVNPPLIRMIAALPMLVSSPRTHWQPPNDSPLSRQEFDSGSHMLQINGSKFLFQFVLARWSLIPVMLLGAWGASRLAADLYGPAAGRLALAMWCFCPNLLAWGGQNTPDAGASALGVLAIWRFHRWLHNPNWQTLVLSSISLGAAALSKSTWLILFSLWPLVWFVWYLRIRREPTRGLPTFRGLCLLSASALYLVNLGYGFERGLQPIRDFAFVSESLGGSKVGHSGGNRFATSLLGKLPSPLPANYLRGIDLQKYEFEQRKWSYLNGEMRLGGWWYYYLYAIAFKTPIGYLCLVIGAIVALLHSRLRGVFRSGEWLLCILVLAVLAIVSSQTGFNRYLRYVLPSIPLMYIFSTRLVMSCQTSARGAGVFVGLCLAAGIASSLAVYPYSMSYFNGIGGGPLGGRHHLLDANIDWGQDGYELRAWYANLDTTEPIHVAYFGVLNLHSLGIDARDVPVPPENAVDIAESAPVEGWYAISVNRLMGYPHAIDDTTSLTYFQQLKPVGYCGYSIYLYHIGPSEAVQLREYFRSRNRAGKDVQASNGDTSE